MITDPDIRDQAYQYFLEEAPELLRTIEEEIFAINEGEVELEDRPLRVNSLMRAAHTLKGGAANVGLETIKTVAHSMEDVFKALYNPELEIDTNTKRLIYESFECLREPLTAEFSQVQVDRDAILDRAAAVFAELQEIFGDYLTDQDAFPTSEELGLDVVESFFDAVIPERLQELATAIASNDNAQVTDTLRTQAEIFLGLAESLALPGFGEIAQTILMALENSSDLALDIAKAAMTNLEAAKQQVIDGDRERGGEPSAELLQLASGMAATPTFESDQIASTQSEPEEEESDAEILASMGQVLEEIENDMTSLTEVTTIDQSQAIAEESTAEVVEQDIQNVEASTSPEEDDEDLDDLFTLSEEDLARLESDDTDHVQTVVENVDFAVAEMTDDTMASMASYEPIESVESPQAEAPQAELLSEMWGEEADIPDSTIVNADFTAIEENAPQDDSIISQAQIFEQPETPTFSSPRRETKKKAEKERKATANKTVRVNLESLEKLNDLVGELLINQNQNILKDEHVYTFVQDLLTKVNYSEQIISRLIDSVEDVYISPEQDKLRQELPQKLSQIVPVNSQNSFQKLNTPEGNVNQLLGLILSNNSEINAIAEKIKTYNKQAQRSTQKQQRMLLNMRDELIDTRMSPINRVFNRFPRMLQQLAGPLL